jgi:hypothetical protein
MNGIVPTFLSVTPVFPYECQIPARRNPRELAHDEFQIALDRSEVGASLVGLAQG